LTQRQKQDNDEDRSRTAAGIEFQAAGPQTAKRVHVKLSYRIVSYRINVQQKL